MGAGIADPRLGRAPDVEVRGNVEGGVQRGDHNIQVNNVHGSVSFRTTDVFRQRRPRQDPRHPPVPFVGRATELAELALAISEHRSVVVSGVDGSGRSALLTRATNEPVAALTDGVLLIDGVNEIGAARSPDDLAQALYNAAYDSDPVPKVTLETVRAEIGPLEVIVVIDDVAMSGPALNRLAGLAPHGAVLMTARVAPLDTDVLDIEMGALARDEAVDLLAATAGLDRASAADSALDELSELLADLPDPIVRAGRAIRARRIDAATALAEARLVAAVAQDPVAVALERAYAVARPALDANARFILATAACLPGISVDPEILRTIVGRPAWFDETTSQLVRLGLLTLNSPRFRVPPGARGAAATGEDRAAVLDRLVDTVVPLAAKRSLDRAFIGAELGTLLGALDWAHRRGRWTETIDLARALDPYLMTSGLWDTLAEVLGRARTAAERAGLPAHGAWATHELGTLALATGDRSAARRLLTDALRTRRQLGDEIGAAYTRHNLERLRGVPPTDRSGTDGGGLGRLARFGIVAIAAVAVLLVGGPVVEAIIGPQPTPTPTAAPSVSLEPSVAPSPSSEPSPSRAASPSSSRSVPPSPGAEVPGRLSVDLAEPRYTVDFGWTAAIGVSPRNGRAPYTIAVTFAQFPERRPVTARSSGPTVVEVPGSGCAHQVNVDVNSSDGQATRASLVLNAPGCDTPPPGVPSLLAPKDETHVPCTGEATLSWIGGDSALRLAYEPTLLIESGTAAFPVDQTRTTRDEHSFKVECGASYQWMVRAVDDVGRVTDFSERWSFGVG